MSVIVVIDDRITNRNILTKLAGLLEEGATVKAFADPAEALTWSETNTPDLVVTDFKMPTMDGAEFVRRFRRQPFCFDIPVMVVTVYEDRHFRYKALEAGATDFLLSPIDHREFKVRARNLLTLRKQQQTIKKRAYYLERRLESTDKLRAQVQRESRERLLQVIDTVPAMISATDERGCYVFVNSYLAVFFGISPDDALGKTPEAVFGESYQTGGRDLDRWIFEHGESVPPYEESVTHRSGSVRHLLTTKSMIKDPNSGQVINVVTASLDITDRKKVEEELREAKDEAETASRSKTEFLANMSHELRTPLNAVIGFAEIMEGELLGPIGSPRYLEYTKDIGDSARHLLNIINDILDVSKIEAGKVDLHEENVDVARVVGDVLRLLRGRADATGRDIRVGDLGDLPRLRADERMLKQILLNVLVNGLKFTVEGGRVGIDTRLTADREIEFTITDDGVGIDPKDIPRALARFGQVEGGMARKYPGTGLGLPLAVSLVDLHGGRFDLESKRGEGTRVTITFPAYRCVDMTDHAG